MNSFLRAKILWNWQAVNTCEIQVEAENHSKSLAAGPFYGMPLGDGAMVGTSLFREDWMQFTAEDEQELHITFSRGNTIPKKDMME